MTSFEAKAVTLSPVLNSVPAPVAGVPNSRLATPEGTDHSASDSPNSPFAAASQMTTDTVSPTAILYSGGGAYFFKRSGKPGSLCVRRTLITASSTLTMSNET